MPVKAEKHQARLDELNSWIVAFLPVLYFREILNKYLGKRNIANRSYLFRFHRPLDLERGRKPPIERVVKPLSDFKYVETNMSV